MQPLLWFVLAGAPLVVSSNDEPPKPGSHGTRAVAGWTVHVDDRLLEGSEAGLGKQAMQLLESQLHYVAVVLPADKVQRLRKVPIWLDLTHGKLVKPQYHPNPAWLEQHGFAKELAACVHIPDARYFAGARFQRSQPCAVLHELAHAYHDQVLGFDHGEIKGAWERFVNSGRYRSVLHISGERRPHYGLTNEREFFAEMSEAFFGHNDFFPFNSSELKQEEPEVFQLLERLWGPLP
jgi:hypothetical protein